MHLGHTKFEEPTARGNGNYYDHTICLHLLRIGGEPKPAYDVWPYPTVKVYDPYGHLEQAGKPGPFYR
jgi:hypothetical protein